MKKIKWYYCFITILWEHIRCAIFGHKWEKINSYEFWKKFHYVQTLQCKRCGEII